jgi:Ca2+:H+ antiporter
MSKEAVRVEVERTPEPEGGEAGWGRGRSLGVLAAVTIGLAVMSEILTDALGPASERLGLTPAFAGIFLLAMVGNAAQILNAASFARANKMDLALGVTVGSSIQVALVVAPVLVFCSHALGHGMDLRFTRFEIVAIVVSVLLTRHLTLDGRSNWLEGLMLAAVYAMFAFAFFWLPPELPGG